MLKGIEVLRGGMGWMGVTGNVSCDQDEPLGSLT